MESNVFWGRSPRLISENAQPFGAHRDEEDYSPQFPTENANYRTNEYEK